MVQIVNIASIKLVSIISKIEAISNQNGPNNSHKLVAFLAGILFKVSHPLSQRAWPVRLIFRDGSFDLTLDYMVYFIVYSYIFGLGFLLLSRQKCISARPVWEVADFYSVMEYRYIGYDFSISIRDIVAMYIYGFLLRPSFISIFPFSYRLSPSLSLSVN